MKPRNWYRILGVAESASPEAIRTAYRRLAKSHHPDRAGAGSKAAFQEIGEAYSVLSDPVAREEHDRTLAGSRSASPSSGGAPVEPLQPPGPVRERPSGWSWSQPAWWEPPTMVEPLDQRRGRQRSDWQAVELGGSPIPRTPFVGRACALCNGEGVFGPFRCPACWGRG